MSTVTTGISIEQYLKTSYTPDVEYIDGQLKEKPAVGLPRGELQALLSQWFGNHRKEWGVRVAVETRTHVQQTKYRLPDVVVIDQAERSKSTLEVPPLIAIEVLSPDNSYRDLRERAQDLHSMGTPNVWLIDSEEQSVAIWMA